MSEEKDLIQAEVKEAEDKVVKEELTKEEAEKVNGGVAHTYLPLAKN